MKSLVHLCSLLVGLVTLSSCFLFVEDDYVVEPPYCPQYSYDWAGCEPGSWFDEETCQCIPSPPCEAVDCPPGHELSDSCTCEPLACEENADCPAGSYCDFPDPIGTCVESSFCGELCPDGEDCAPCPDGQVCNESRDTCEPVNCADYDEETCIAADAYCSPTYYGTNCEDPDGLPCTSGSASCVCENFYFAGCAEGP